MILDARRNADSTPVSWIGKATWNNRFLRGSDWQLVVDTYLTQLGREELPPHPSLMKNLYLARHELRSLKNPATNGNCLCDDVFAPNAETDSQTNPQS